MKRRFQKGKGFIGSAVLLGALVLVLTLPLFARGATPPIQGFDEVLGDTLIGPYPGGAFFLAEWLSENGQPAAAERLRRALWQLQLTYIRGEAIDPTLTVGQAIARGSALPPPGPEFLDAWQQAYTVSTTLIYRLELPRPFWATQALPPDLPDASGLKPLESGLWWQPREHGARFVLAVDLHNNGLAALAPQGLRLRLGSERAAVSFDCLTVPAPTGSLAREREVYVVDQTYSLACEALGPESWRDTLPDLLAHARDRSAPAQLLPRPPPDSPRAERAYWKDIRHYVSLKEQWSHQFAFSADPTVARRGWVASTKPLSPPEFAPVPPTWLERTKAQLGLVKSVDPPALNVMALVPELGGMLLSWLLFVVVRAWLREASQQTQATAVTFIAVLATLPFVFNAWGGGLGHGDGWSRLGVLAGGLGMIMIGSSVAIGALLLQALYRVLDADGITWADAVAAGWRRMFHIGGLTSRGGFWGFVSFALVLLLLSARLGRPWPAVVVLALMVPLGTLMTRRVTSLTPKEFWVGLAVILAFVANHFVDR